MKCGAVKLAKKGKGALQDETRHDQSVQSCKPTSYSTNDYTHADTVGMREPLSRLLDNNGLELIRRDDASLIRDVSSLWRLRIREHHISASLSEGLQLSSPRPPTSFLFRSESTFLLQSRLQKPLASLLFSLSKYVPR